MATIQFPADTAVHDQVPDLLWLTAPATRPAAAPLMGPASPSTAIPVMGPADRGATPLMYSAG